jgi:cytochrome c5
MKLIRTLLAMSVMGLGVALIQPMQPSTARADDKPAPKFSEDVGPFLKKYCSSCHGEEKPKAGVTLDGSYDGLMKAMRKGKSLITASSTEKSLLYSCISGAKPMPPRQAKAKPTKDEIAKIKEWIKAGAKNDE